MRDKCLHEHAATLAAAGIVVVACSLRLTFMALHWPALTADEAIMDLMARHIAYQGAHPIFYWGQHYMGALQAYLGAAAIRLFGSSAFSVRLGTLLMYALYLVCVYGLARLLYTPGFALAVIALLSFGSDRVMGFALGANGGYAETLLFGAAIFLLASWFAITTPARLPARTSSSRLLAYAVLGVTAGLALWSDELILPAILLGGALLVLCCHRELRGWTLVVLVAGLLTGAAPLIRYNVSAAPGEDSLSILLGTVFAGSPRVVPVWEQLAHVALITLPLATSMPFSDGIHTACRTVEPYTHPTGGLAALFPSSNPALCVAVHGGWSLMLLLLWGIALAAALRTIRRLRTERLAGADPEPQATRRQLAREYARLMVLASAALWLVLFAVSAAAQETPRASSRYLAPLVLAAPSVLWPLWRNLRGLLVRDAGVVRFARWRAALSAATLCVIAGVALLGTGDIVANLPAAQSAYTQTDSLVQALLEQGATRVYSDYNTCSLLIFRSDERVICGVLNERLQLGINRYPPYLARVRAAPHAAYLFPAGSPAAQALALQMGTDRYYQSAQVAGYVIYYYDTSRTTTPARQQAPCALCMDGHEGMGCCRERTAV